jgi:hypothetical protein
MHVIRHDYRNAKIYFCAVVMQAGFQHNRANLDREYPPLMRAEGNEMLLEVTLHMRKRAPVKSLRHDEQSRDSRHRLSGGANLSSHVTAAKPRRSIFRTVALKEIPDRECHQRKSRRATLARTAEAAIPTRSPSDDSDS